MPLYVIERNFADQLELSDDDVRLIQTVNGDEGVHWLFSFLSADRHPRRLPWVVWRQR